MRARVVLLSLLVAASAGAPLIAGFGSQQRDLVLPERRLALVIGNDRYAAVPLQNGVADAESMGAELRAIGFDVTVLTNGAGTEIERAVDTLARRLGPNDIVFFYYAGHGVSVENENYLVPVDFTGKDETDVKYRALSAGHVLEKLAHARVRIAVLDACRTNPFRAGRDTGGGLAAMRQARGTLVAFATAPGMTASDNPTGTNGLYTQELLKALRVPGLNVTQLFKTVQENVDRISDGMQFPWVADGLVGQLVLRPSTAAPTAPTGAAPTAPVPPARVTVPGGSGRPAASADERPSTSAPVVPAATAAPAGAAASVASTEASSDIDHPAPLSPGQVVRGRLADRDAGGKSHYWRTTLPAGDYKVVLDIRRADRQDSSIGGELEWLTADGQRLESIGAIYEVDDRLRAVFRLTASDSDTTIVRYSNSYTVSDYWLGVFPATATIPAPFFAGVPPLIPLTLGATVQVRLLGDAVDRRDAYYAIRLAAGDYRITTDYRRADGRDGTVGGCVFVLDGDGRIVERLNAATEIDVFTRTSGTVSLADDTDVVVKVRAFYGAEDVSLRIEKIVN